MAQATYASGVIVILVHQTLTHFMNMSKDIRHIFLPKKRKMFANGGNVFVILMKNNKN